MQNNPLDDIVKCDIEIANPGSDDATFDSILLVVPAPEAEGIAKLTKLSMSVYSNPKIFSCVSVQLTTLRTSSGSLKSVIWMP